METTHPTAEATTIAGFFLQDDQRTKKIKQQGNYKNLVEDIDEGAEEGELCSGAEGSQA